MLGGDLRYPRYVVCRVKAQGDITLTSELHNGPLRNQSFFATDDDQATFDCYSAFDLDCDFSMVSYFCYNCCKSCSLDFFSFGAEDFEQEDRDVWVEYVRAIENRNMISLFVFEAEAKGTGSDFWHFSADRPSPNVGRRNQLVVVGKLCGMMLAGLGVRHGERVDAMDDYS